MHETYRSSCRNVVMLMQSVSKKGAGYAGTCSKLQIDVETANVHGSCHTVASSLDTFVW